MSQKSGTPKLSSERIVKDIRRATRKQYSAEEKIRIVLDGLLQRERIKRATIRNRRLQHQMQAA
jgi:transposase